MKISNSFETFEIFDDFEIFETFEILEQDISRKGINRMTSNHYSRRRIMSTMRLRVSRLGPYHLEMSVIRSTKKIPYVQIKTIMQPNSCFEDMTIILTAPNMQACLLILKFLKECKIKV